MNRNSRLTDPSILYVLFFFIVITGFGILSSYNLMKHFVNDEPDTHKWLPEHEDRLETDIANAFYGQFGFVNLNGLMSGIMGERELNSVIKLNNGYLYTQPPYYTDEEIAGQTGQVIAFNEYLKKRGVPLIFTITPNTSSKYDPQIPTGYTDPGNDNLDRIAEALKNGGVQVIDYREELKNDGIDAYEMMYRTDHHWTTKMGFYAYLKLAGILEKELDCRIDPRVKDIDSYTVKTYEKWHLGSRGQRTGKYFGGVDDFDLIVPDFETLIVNNETGKEGGYADMLVDTEVLTKKDVRYLREDIGERSVYDMVLEDSLGDHTNLLSENDKRIMITGDSFAKAVIPFIDISFERVKWLDRPINEDDIDDLEPDAVIMIYDLSDNLLTEDFDYEWARSDP